MTNARHEYWKCNLRYVAVLLAIGFAVLPWLDLQRTPKTPPTKYGEVMTYLVRHGKPGDVVLNTHWTDFVLLLWHSTGFKYVSGLDGHYLMYGDDSSHFEFWFELRDLENFVGEDVGHLAIERFGARWMVVPRESLDLAALVRRSAQARQVVDSDDGWLFELKSLDAGRPF